VIENGPAAGGFLQDATPNTCFGVSQAALYEIFNTLSTGQTGAFKIMGAACGGAAGVLDYPASNGVNPSITFVAPGTAGSYQPVSRLDLPSGTEDTFSGYIGTGSSAPASGFAGIQVTGNLGVLAKVQSTANTIGFVDIGFAEGKAAGVTGKTAAGDACGVAVAEVETDSVTTFPYATAQCTSTTANCYAATGTTLAGLDSLVKSALANYATINPLTTANPSTNVYPDSGGSLARSFYYVTNGTPTPVEQEFLNFMTSPNAESYFTNNGYYPVYAFSTA